MTGVAFAAAVNSLGENLVMPIVAMIVGKPDFRRDVHDQRRGLPLRVHHHVIQLAAIAAAVFFFVVKPVQAMLERRRREPIEEGVPDEERRHQELLAALRARS